MPCPNCGQKTDSDVIDGQNILHCSSCGGTFFQDNGINRISFSSAQKLADDKISQEISDGDKICPQDQSVMKPLISQENIPPDVTLYHCDNCRGIFTQPNDLVIFKKAQAAKIDYFKIWGIPLPSIRSVAVLSIFLFVFVMSLVTYLYWQHEYVYRIQASDLIKNEYVTVSGRYLFISFVTNQSLRSKIIITDKTTNQVLEKDINIRPASFHQFTTSDINIDHQINYQIILIDEKGRIAKTDSKKLEVSK